MLKIQTNAEGYISIASAVISIEQERLIMTDAKGEVREVKNTRRPGRGRCKRGFLYLLFHAYTCGGSQPLRLKTILLYRR